MISDDSLRGLDRVHHVGRGDFRLVLENGIDRLRVQSDRRGYLQRVRSYRLVYLLPVGDLNTPHGQLGR